MLHIAELEVELEAAMALVSSKLKPNLMLRNNFMPCESSFCPIQLFILLILLFLHTAYVSPQGLILPVSN